MDDNQVIRPQNRVLGLGDRRRNRTACELVLAGDQRKIERADRDRLDGMSGLAGALAVGPGQGGAEALGARVGMAVDDENLAGPALYNRTAAMALP